MFKNIKLKKVLMGASLGLLGVGAVVGSTVVYNNYVEQSENPSNINNVTSSTYSETTHMEYK